MTNRSEVKEGRVELNYACLTVLFAFLLGGGVQQNIWSDHLIQVMMTPLIFIGFYRLPKINLNRWVWVVCGLSLGLIVLQFIPVHSQFKLPNPNVEIYQTFWTASPSKTIESALFFTTCLGLFIYLSSISRPAKIKILKILLIGILIQSILVIFQLSYSSKFELLGLLPFTIKSGLFANHNHTATMLFSTIPVLGFIYLIIQDNKKLFICLSILLILLLFAIGSRAGMAFAIVQFLLSIIWSSSQNSSISTKLSVFSFCVFIGILALYLLDFSSTLEGDLRSEIFENTWHAIEDNWLFGSGLGTFVLLYPSYETIDQIFTYYINHAHNDYLELLLEVGIFVFVPISIYFYCVIKNILTHKNAGILGIALLAILAHSFLDYPLRTFSIAVMLTTISAILFQNEK